MRASSTGLQLADEIQQSGRQVTLAAGRHTRLPRQYRGQDILWWLDRLGTLNQPVDAVHAIEISRQQPSLQLVGRTDHSSLDLAMLHERGVRVVGRVRDLTGHHVSLADDLIASTAAADMKMAEILTRIDRFIATNALPAAEPEPFRPGSRTHCAMRNYSRARSCTGRPPHWRITKVRGTISPDGCSK